jgi:hypothetical protein
LKLKKKMMKTNTNQLLFSLPLFFPLSFFHSSPPYRLKNDFEGTDNHWIGNVIAFVDGALLHNGYGGQIGQPGKGYLDGHEAMFINNTAIVNYDGSYAKPICTGTPGTTIMSGSKVFSPKGQLTTDCGATFDTGAVYSTFTSTMADDMIGYAREALFN